MNESTATYSPSLFSLRRIIAEEKPLSTKMLERAVKIAKAPIKPNSRGDKSLIVINPTPKATIWNPTLSKAFHKMERAVCFFKSCSISNAKIGLFRYICERK